MSERLPTRSDLRKYVDSDRFVWATGIEDTFIPAPHPSTGRILDEYELTEHYTRWQEDIDLIPELGVSAARYGLPWYLISPAPGKWDWSFADKALNRLLERGIDPIVDLVHYGTPVWMESSFRNLDYPNYVAEYASRVAERFKGQIRWYTPLNEPRINAYYAGKLGFWPPYARGWTGFVAVLTQICKGIVLTSEALTSVDSEIVRCHVDATDLYEAVDEASREKAAVRQEVVFLALDLVTGRVDSSHFLFSWLTKHGFSQEDLEWFQTNKTTPDVLGINLYPMFSSKKVSTVGGRTRFKMPYSGDAPILKQLGQMYWERYRVPLMVTETASAGSVAKRARWLTRSIEDCSALREAGVPMIGYTWWPMFSLVAWAYLGSEHDISRHIVPMGLWDLDSKLDRNRTPLVDQFAQYVASTHFSLIHKETFYVS